MAVTTKRTRLVLGGLFFATMFVYAGGTAYQTFETRKSSTGWVASARGGQVVVEEVIPGGPAAELRPGDVVVALDGRRLDGPTAVRDLAAREPGHVYALSVEREGAPTELSLRTAPPPSFANTYYTLLVVVIPLIFISTGLAVFALRPEDKQAVLLALMFGTFIPGGAATLRGLPDWLADAMVVGAVVSSFFAAVFFHFFLIFPERSPLLRRYPRLEYALYVPQLLLVAPYAAYTAYVQEAAAVNLFAERGRLGPWGVAAAALVVAYVVAGVASLGFNYVYAGRQSRRKMRVVVAGCALGFLPSLLLTAVYFYGPARIDETRFKWLSAAAGVAFLAFPFSLAYAIIRHQVIPVRLMFRRGMRHVFVARGSVLLEVLTVGLALALFLQYFFNYVRPSSGLVIGVVSGVFSVLVWNLTTELHYRVIAPAIDRRFFRRAYNAQQILADLGQSLRPLTDTRETAQFVAARLRDALQPENVSVFLRDAATGDYVCVISSHHIDAGRVTLDGAADLQLPRDAFTVRRLRESAQPLAVDFQDPQSWASMLLSADLELTATRRRESETLRQINSSLLVPVATQSELHGVISVGPRLGDLPYSREDRQVLTAVALQMSFAVENALLLKRKVEEDRLRREVEMATEVQRRLFPERPPWLDSVELAGICLPARGVGGDYYDFILLDEERVGVAVADVAGKGISAALLMSTVQASLRSRAEQVDDRLTDLVSSMNRLLNRSTNSASYASFFYALFDGRQRQLTYVNAGHNPPLLVRARPRAARAGSAAGEARRLSVGAGAEGGGVLLSSGRGTETCYLEKGGPVIGLFDEFVYEQETIKAESGDVLVAYTDGVTEALNPHGEEFGQERLEALVADLAHLPAEDLMKRVIEDLRRWCLNTPQHDDVTLVVVKVR